MQNANVISPLFDKLKDIQEHLEYKTNETIYDTQEIIGIKKKFIELNHIPGIVFSNKVLALFFENIGDKTSSEIQIYHYSKSIEILEETIQNYKANVTIYKRLAKMNSKLSVAHHKVKQHSTAYNFSRKANYLFKKIKKENPNYLEGQYEFIIHKDRMRLWSLRAEIL